MIAQQLMNLAQQIARREEEDFLASGAIHALLENFDSTQACSGNRERGTYVYGNAVFHAKVLREGIKHRPSHVRKSNGRTGSIFDSRTI
jgi:hypothetical protein